jgi:hypothetical protein
MQFHSARFTTALAPVRQLRSAKGRRPALTLKVRLRFAIAFLAGASLFMFALLTTMVFLSDRHCGSEFSYYGCETLIVRPSQ